MRLRTWNGPADTTAMQRLASRTWPLGWHPGGLGWCGATAQLPAKVVVAEDADCLVGWAGLAGGSLTLQVDPDCPAAAEGLVAWALAVAEVDEITVQVFDGDETARAAVAEAGFVPVPEAAPFGGMFRDVAVDADLAGLAGSGQSAGSRGVPDGYRIRSVRASELDARVEVHRRAWRPATLPWPGDPPSSVTEESASRFTAALYSRVRATWLYDPAFDLVVEAPDGSLAACCIAWWDPATKCAEIEPVGVAPEHRRRGLASAMCWHVIDQIRAGGGQQVFIGVGPDPAYPAPAATYLAVGFDFVVRGRLFSRGR